MLENIVRHMEMGKSPMRAAFDGSQEVAFTIVSMTLSLTAVFIPVLFMGGVVGRLLHEFAVTIGVAILVSGFVSISLTPMLCSRFLKPPHAQKHGWFYNATERMFDAWLRLYDWTLRADAAATAPRPWRSRSRCSSRRCYLFTVVPKGFLPSEDQGRFNINTEGVQGIGFDEMVRHQQQVADIVAQGSEHRLRSRSSVGFGPGASGSNQGSMNIELKPRAERKLSVDQVIAGAAAEAGAGAGHARLHDQPAADQHRRPAARRALYQFTLQDTDTDELYRVGADPRREDAGRCPGSRTSTATCSSRTRRSPSTWTATRSSALGLTVNQVETAMFNAYGTRQVSQIYAPNNQYQVILGVAPEFQRDPSALSHALRAVVHRPADPAEHRRQGDDRAPARCPSATPASCRRSRSPSTSSRASRSATP